MQRDLSGQYQGIVTAVSDHDIRRSNERLVTAVAPCAHNMSAQSLRQLAAALLRDHSENPVQHPKAVPVAAILELAAYILTDMSEAWAIAAGREYSRLSFSREKNGVELFDK